MSKHECPVIKIKLEEHPNADSLSLVKIHGFQCAVRTQDWKDGDLAAYIMPDSIVPDSEPFQFLKSSDSKKWNRVRARKLRGYISMGLLVPAPPGSKEGDNVMEALGVSHYEPPLPASTGGDNESGPVGYFPKYDVENLRRYNTIFQNGEEVIATEKIHGTSAKYCYSQGRMWVGSRTNWKKKDRKNVWWQALNKNPWIQEWCKQNPRLVLYGEVFGPVQKLRYGTKPGDVRFLVFDILDGAEWLSYDEMKEIGNNEEIRFGDCLDFVPELYRGPFDINVLEKLSEGPSTVLHANHMREGIVIRPVAERQDPKLGRVQLKLVSNEYLSSN